MMRGNVDLEARNVAGAPPLMLALLSGNAALSRVLIDAGADLHALAENGSNTVFAAAVSGLTDIVIELLEAGVTPNNEVRITQTDVIDSVAKVQSGERKSVVRLSSEQMQEGIQDIEGFSEEGMLQTPLATAMAAGHPDIALELIKSGADVNVDRGDGWLPIHTAAHIGRTDLLVAMLDRDADPSAKTADQFVPLHFAVEGAHPEVIRVLLERGADVNAQIANGATALMCAAEGGLVDICELLLAHGADKHRRLADGTTAAGLAVNPALKEMLS